ncbi:MAG: dephospho-CoA kinase [Saprospiraceae bacterium]
MKVGITGGMGSGKTTVCQIFEELNIPVYYADTEAKKLMTKNKSVKSEIKKLLSADSYFRNGRPNRPFISSKVFSNKALLDKLNQIIHPAVHDDFDLFYQQHNKTAPFVLNEAALLVENGSYHRFDALIVVTCPESIRIERIMKRDKVGKDIVLRRLENQLPEEAKIKHASYIIDNDGQHPLLPQVWKIYQTLLKMNK